MNATRRPRRDQVSTGRGRVGAGPPWDAAAPSAKSIRCFVALQPDEAARARLDELAAAQHSRFPGARRMRRDNLHLTLAFIGQLDAAVAQQVAAGLAALSIGPFAWTLATIGAFGRSGVLWAGDDDERLGTVAARVRHLLDELGVSYDRKPFVAHVTLLRKLPRAAARDAAAAIEPPIAWRVADVVLLQSTTDAAGSRYSPVTASG